MRGYAVSFDPNGALFKIATPPPVTKVLSNSKPTLPTPPTGPAVNQPPTL